MNRTLLTILFIYISLFAPILLGVVFLSKPTFYIFVIGWLLVGVICTITPTSLGFATLIAVILAYGFYTVAIAWNKNWSMLYQETHISTQAIFALGAVSVWLLIYSFKKDWGELQHLQNEVKRLQKYEMTTKILTMNEFIEKSKLLYLGMKRRQENGFYLLCRIKPEGIVYKDRIHFEKLATHILQTVRNNYDLIGKYAENTVIVFLSNINSKGVEIVLNRFREGLAKENHLSLDRIEISTFELPNSWESFEAYLSQQTWRAMT